VTGRNPFLDASKSGQALEPFQTISVAQPRERDRSWESKNRAFSYRIPQRLREEAIEVRESILSVATYDEMGNPRLDRTTVDDVASAFIGYALAKASEENLTFAPTRQGKMKLEWEEAEQGWASIIEIKKVVKKKKQKKPKQIFLGYRWTSENHAEIEKLAGENRPTRFREDGSIIPDPHRFSVSPGEIIVRLLQRAIIAYKERNLRLMTRPETAAQKVTGWSSR
jgi:hypothetical protein